MKSSRRCVLVLLDGLADRAQNALGGLTPLQAAATPALDRLASQGACGHFHALSPGQALSSEAAHFFMMGYSPAEFPGRGYLEALGEGVEVGPGQVALLTHLARCRHQGDELVLQEKKPPLPDELAAGLIAAVQQYDSELGWARFQRTKGSSGVLVLGGPALSPRITDSDPMYPGLPLMEPLPWAEARGDPAALAACALLKAYLAWAHTVLAGHAANTGAADPVNAVITQRAGQGGGLPTLADRWGLRVLSISSAPIYRGVFRALGAEAWVVPEEADPGQDLEAKLALARERGGGFDLIHVHSKAPDEAGHRKDPAHKQAVIQSLDAGLGRALTGLDPAETLLAVTGDHATACSGDMVHSGEPSPLLLWGHGVWRDQAVAFNETACAAGALGLLRGTELMYTILNGLDRGKLWGLRDNPRDLPYYPAPRRALKLSE
ncbi:MAG: alkaline phosphatase family protein [Desulfarculaceae bacterium]|nr:alkaline phosphatase family protein [Desulfarculaceae bacterium]MCF8071633.1 alkaline phosphatase family protein [Desulfarculaceae bacterium]MCF8103170.1 alkaline phosphatase family protein [Desulfarculaceae bacterium]MCF8114912.1 alkaline phosphatase family protein [Desulfarculaceae bacterium]